LNISLVFVLNQWTELVPISDGFSGTPTFKSLVGPHFQLWEMPAADCLDTVSVITGRAWPKVFKDFDDEPDVFRATGYDDTERAGF
jgi:hypothetical protein